MNNLLSTRTFLVGALIAGSCTQAFAALKEATDADKAPGTPLYAFIKYTEALQKGDKTEALKYGTEMSVSSYFDKDPIYNGRRQSVNGRDTQKPYSQEMKKSGQEFCTIEFDWVEKGSNMHNGSEISFIKTKGEWKVCEKREIKGKK